MKKKDVQELKTHPAEELARMAKEANEKLRALRFDLAAGKVKNVSEIHALRKRIARMHTFIRASKDAK